MTLLYWPYKRFHTLDEQPALDAFTPKEQVELGYPAQVNVGMYIKDFVNVDITNGAMTIDALVWFIFDPTKISLEKISKFSFANGTIEEPKRENLYEMATTEIVEGNNILAQYNVRASFELPIDFRLFPIDDHTTYFILVNEYVSPRQMVFYSSRYNFMVYPSIEAFGWKQADRDMETGFQRYAINEYDERNTKYAPRALFSIDYRRIGLRHVISIFLPLLLIFFTSLFAFSFDLEGPNAGQSFGFAAGGITAMITYYFVIQNMSPPVSYFMISDYLYYLFLSLNFLVFMIIMFRAGTSIRQKRLILMSLHAIVILYAGYLFMFWLR